MSGKRTMRHKRIGSHVPQMEALAARKGRRVIRRDRPGERRTMNPACFDEKESRRLEQLLRQTDHVAPRIKLDHYDGRLYDARRVCEAWLKDRLESIPRSLHVRLAGGNYRGRKAPPYRGAA